MHRRIEKVLEREYGWFKLCEVKGTVGEREEGPVEHPTEFDLGLLGPNHEFSRRSQITINLHKPTSITKFVIVVIGPQWIFDARPVLQDAFHSLLIDLSIGKERREVPLIKEGKLNQAQFSLMGEIKDWLMYYWKGWDTVRLGHTDEIRIDLRVHGRTRARRRDAYDFTMQLYLKMEIPPVSE